MTVYFLKVTQWNLGAIALFNIIFYFVTATFFFILSGVIKCGKKIQVYQVGILLYFVFFLLIGLLKDKTGHYIYYLAVIQGIATTFYWFPYNVYVFDFNSPSDRSLYFSYDKILGSAIGIIVPIIFGTVIVLASYQAAILISLVFTGLALAVSFKLSNNETFTAQLNLKDFIYKLIQGKKSDVFRTYICEFLRGFNYCGALATVITILIYMSFLSEFSLGVLNSVLSIVSIIVTILIVKFLKEKYFKITLIFACITLFFGTFVLVFSINHLSIILYNIILNITLPVLTILQTVYTYNVVENEDLVQFKIEHLVLREVALNGGRILGFVLLLASSLHKMDINLIRVILIVLSFSILLISYQTQKFKMTC